MSDGARPVLLTVSGVMPPDLAESIRSGKRPRADYLELAAAFDADLVDYESAERRATRGGRIVRRLGGRNLGLAWHCFVNRRRYDVIVTDGEQVGLPLAALLRFAGRRRRARHIMIVHILSVPKKVRLFRLLRLGRFVDEMIVYSSAQQRFLVETLGYPANAVTLTPFMVDTAFFVPDGEVGAHARPKVSSAGLEFRDYPTLLEAVRGLDVDVVLAAASPWSKRGSGLESVSLPGNVRVVRLDLHQLRQLYAESRVVVLPLHEVDFQAGVTTLLEAMSMARPVVCTRTSGQTDVLTDGATGVYVPSGDPLAMRRAIVELLDDPGRATALGGAAREWVVASADIDVYVRKLAARVAHHRAQITR